MTMHRTVLIISAIALVAACGASTRAEVELQTSVFDQGIAQLRADYSVQSMREANLQTEGEFGGATSQTVSGRKSPAKAFLLSLALPGAGQYYNGGSILKPLGFLAVEATAWGLYFKYHGEGNDLTDEFEAYNRAHWSRGSYAQYLYMAYGDSSDNNVSATEISHHLPGTETQQYFEMTGKYNQFAWGWDDAELNDTTLQDYINNSINPPKMVNDTRSPSSAHRLTYETMRHHANEKFDKATTMIIVSMANRMISAFEAYLSAKRHNRSVNPAEFGRVDVKAKLKSIYSFADTPTLKVSVRF